jgi:hypothetical protein
MATAGGRDWDASTYERISEPQLQPRGLIERVLARAGEPLVLEYV